MPNIYMKQTTGTMENVDKFECLLRILNEENEIDGKKFLLRDDFEKFFVNGNKRAGVRIRKVMQRLKSAAQEIRDDVQNYKRKI